MNVNIKLTDLQCAFIICSAYEGGIGYWAQSRNVEQKHFDGCDFDLYSSVELLEIDDDESGWDWDKPDAKPLTLDIAAVRRGVKAILEGKEGCGVRADIKASILNDDVDSDAADCIVQAALLGEIKYG